MTRTRKLFIIIFSILIIFSLNACSSTQSDFALQSAALVLSHIKALPEQVNPGGTVILDIGLASISEHLQRGKVIVTDSQGNAYQEEISDLKETLTTTLISSFRLSPLVPSGDLLLQVFVLDSVGNSSNTGFVTITVL